MLEIKLWIEHALKHSTIVQLKHVQHATRSTVETEEIKEEIRWLEFRMDYLNDHMIQSCGKYTDRELAKIKFLSNNHIIPALRWLPLLLYLHLMTSGTDITVIGIHLCHPVLL